MYRIVVNLVLLLAVLCVPARGEEAALSAAPVTTFPIRVQKYTACSGERVRIIVPVKKCRIIVRSSSAAVDVLSSFVILDMPEPCRFSVKAYKTPDPQQEDARLEIDGQTIRLSIPHGKAYEIFVTYNEQDDD